MTPIQLVALDQIAVAAVACEIACACPAELSVAQAGLESGWLTRMSGANNCFGIKANAGVAGRELCPTTEWFTPEELARFMALGEGRMAAPAWPVKVRCGRQLYRVTDWFASFDSLEACFLYHGQLLQRGVYQPAWDAYRAGGSKVGYIRALAHHYATDPGYAEEVLQIAMQANVAAAIAKARAASVPAPAASECGGLSA